MMEKTISGAQMDSAMNRIDAGPSGRRTGAFSRPGRPGALFKVLVAGLIILGMVLLAAPALAPVETSVWGPLAGIALAVMAAAIAARRRMAAAAAASRQHRLADEEASGPLKNAHAIGAESQTAADKSAPRSSKASGAGTFTFDTRTQALHASDEALALFGLERSRFDRRLETVLACVHPDDRIRVEKARRRLHAGHEIMQCEYRVLRAGRQERAIRETGSLTAAAGDLPALAVTVVVDITDDRRYEYEAHEVTHPLASTLTLRKLFIDSSPEVICSIDGNGCILNIGTACERLWHYTPTELLGTRFQLLVHPEDIERTVRMLKKGAPGERLLDFENRHLRKDGEVVVMLWNVFWTELNGMVVCSGRDVTGERRKQALEQTKQEILTRIASHTPLANSLKALCNLYDSSHPGTHASILLLDESREHLHHGAAPGLPSDYNRFIDGLRIEPNIGSCCEVILRRHRIISSDIEEDPIWTGARTKALQYGLRACWSTPILSSEDSVLGTFAVYCREPRAPSEQELSDLDSLVSIAGVAIAQDRVLRRMDESRQRFTSLFEQHPDSVYALDQDGRFTLCNTNFLKLTGRPAEHYIGRSIDQAIPRQFRADAWRHLAFVLKGNTSRFRFRTVDTEGSRIELDAMMLPVVVGGRVTGAFVVMTDVTPLYLAQEELQRSLKRSIRLSEQLRHLADSAIEANLRADDNGLLQTLADALRETLGAREAVLITNDASASDVGVTVSPAERETAWTPHITLLHECGLHDAEKLGETPVRLTRDQIDAHTGWRAFARGARELAPRSGCLTVPLTARDGQSLGFLHVFDPADGEFSVDDELVATQFAQNISAAVARRQLIARLQVRDRFFEMSLEPFCIFDLKHRRLIEINNAMCQALGRSREYLMAHDHRELLFPEDRDDIDTKINDAYQGGSGSVQQSIYRHMLPDGSLRTIEWSWFISAEKIMYSTGRDITERSRVQAQLAHAITHDAVTDLPRVETVEETLKKRLEAEPGGRVNVIFMDLDRFFSINESMGHATADRVLHAVAQRIRQLIPNNASVARISGDEFLAVLPELSAEQSHEVAERIRHALLEPFAIDGYRIRLSASIGIAAYPEHGATAIDLVRRAQAAVVNAKRQGRDTVCVFTAEQVHDIQDRQLLGNHLRNAVEREEMVLHYQPQYSAETRRLTGFEALIRWHSPELGLLFPSRFISVAESIGVMPELGQWVIREACRQMRVWLDAGHSDFTVSVNVSAQQLLRQGLVSLVKTALDEYRLPADYLEIELTESTAMENVERTHATLHGLKELGVRLALDDFGTGYSSLAYLKQFEVDKLKIDKSFVRDLPDDTNDAAIARTIIGIGHQLRMRVAAEGVETVRQRDFLVAIGCDELQGFLFSPGVPAVEATQMLATR
jgi:diguanylate cyclase (GGDEF)-like protein/PAS domain S-box-containing protein